MGDTTEKPVDIEQMNRELEQSGSAAGGGRRRPEEN